MLVLIKLKNYLDISYFVIPKFHGSEVTRSPRVIVIYKIKKKKTALKADRYLP